MTPIPIAETADQSQVDRVRPIVEGRDCVVIGSAPLKTATADVDAGELVIAVNGGISSVPGVADLWVLNSKQQDRPHDVNLKPLHKTMLKQGKDKTAGHLLLLRGPAVASEQWTLGFLNRQGTTYQSWSVFDKATKVVFEREYCNRVRVNRPCSAGILSVALALACGASRVRMVGFSFKPGYHYLQDVTPAYWWRDHVEADQRALRAMSARFGDRLEGEILKQVAA